MIYFQKVLNNNTIRELSKTAIEVFKEHYYPILAEEQCEYMVKLFHTPSAIKQQQRQGAIFYLVYSNTEVIGFFAIEKHGVKMYLSRLYLRKEYRRNGIGRRMLNKVFELSENCQAVYLRVNKQNDDSLHFYLHQGFVEIGQMVEDIGSGYKMDDYILQKELKKIEPIVKNKKGEKKGGNKKERNQSRSQEENSSKAGS
ncbi:GNAT family N-acetyltransferase [bacterium]|nr:GNAT family N-acetyltransferase [bacterium]